MQEEDKCMKMCQQKKRSEAAEVIEDGRSKIDCYNNVEFTKERNKEGYEFGGLSIRLCGRNQLLDYRNFVVNDNILKYFNLTMMRHKQVLTLKWSLCLPTFGKHLFECVIYYKPYL